jgi:hypothetical protein
MKTGATQSAATESSLMTSVELWNLVDRVTKRTLAERAKWREAWTSHGKTPPPPAAVDLRELVHVELRQASGGVLPGQIFHIGAGENLPLGQALDPLIEEAKARLERGGP